MKLLFMIIIYFAGFATAIYMTVPPAEGCQEGVAASPIISQEVAQTLSSGVDKCIDFGKDATSRAYAYIRQRCEQRPEPEGSG